APGVAQGRRADHPVGLTGSHPAPDLPASGEPAPPHSFFLRAVSREVPSPRVRAGGLSDPALAQEGDHVEDAGEATAPVRLRSLRAGGWQLLFALTGLAGLVGRV